MKNVQARLDESVEEFINKLQTVIAELAVEAITQRLRPQLKRRRGPATPYRTPAAVSALADSLYGQICAQPGETMMVLSKAVGEKSGALAVPVRKLLAGGRVKKVGQRADTRYFPVGRQARPKPKGPSVKRKRGGR